MISNFSVIDNFLQFESGTFYKFELLVRNTDGVNELFIDGCSNTNKNILIKSWYVDNREYYEKIKHEMIALADITGARLYMVLDKKENIKLVQNLIHTFTNTLCTLVSNQMLSIKSISKAFASETSKVESSCKNTKTIMFDVDTKDERILQLVIDYIQSKKQQPYILDTKKGFHVFCYKKFNHSDWLDWIINNYSKHMEFKEAVAENNYESSFKSRMQEVVSVKENELGLVYHPMKQWK